MKKVVWLMMESERGEHSSAIIFWYGILEQLGYEVIYYPYETYEPEQFYSEMKSYKPDFVFHPCYDKLHLELTRLREFCKVFVIQSDDDWRLDSYAKYYIPFVDGTISYQADRQQYLNHGALEHQIISAKWAFNPNTMMVEQPNDVKDIFISHGGSLYGDREQLIYEFGTKGLPVTTASQVLYGQLLELWDRSKYSLCFTRSSQGGFRQKKGRVAEIGFHSVLVSEPFPNIEHYYVPDREFILFQSVDEAVEKIRRLEAEPVEYQKMLAASKKRVWNTNTVFHEWNRIMGIIDCDFKSPNIETIIKLYETNF